MSKSPSAKAHRNAASNVSSIEARKNLVNTLQKLGLVAIVVSVALLSNAMLALDNTAETAGKELLGVTVVFWIRDSKMRGVSVFAGNQKE
jgi:hypothetical protein